MTVSQEVSFIQSATPPLRDGQYTLSATQTVPGQSPAEYPATATFVVSGERFTLSPSEIDSVFPPNLAAGPFDGVFAHVVLDRCTLPWERAIDTPGQPTTYAGTPWLAVLVCDDASAPSLQPVTAKDLVPLGAPIAVSRTPSVTGTGTLAATTLSYGSSVLGTLDFGETPDDPCTVVDLPVELFSQIAPAASDLAYLAHVREVDTSDGADADANSTAESHAVIVGNRIPTVGSPSRAFLVSLEGLAELLPHVTGTPAAALGSATLVRLIVFHSWTFTANALDDTLEQLLTGLNEASTTTALALPITGTAPTAARVAQALTDQAAGALVTDDATVLMQNALLMGYVPMDHHLRHGGHTVSFYRGPLVPQAVPRAGTAHYSGPDAANAYNPQTGLFDASYGAAWQLGQLLALQNAGMASQLFQWKQRIRQLQALAAEESWLQGGEALFPSLLTARATALDLPRPGLPAEVAAWFGRLASLTGVPFNYLVPDERMLPPESLRLVYLDDNWLDALIDGAFSVGRAVVAPDSLEAEQASTVRQVAREQCGLAAANRQAGLARDDLAPVDPTTPVTGFLLRSAAVAGWPNLRMVGFSDAAATTQLPALRIAQLSNDTVLCLFRGVVAAVYLREPPEQLHHGVDVAGGAYTTTLRSVSGGPGTTVAGAPYDVTEPIPMRADGHTVEVTTAASNVHTRLQDDFQQSFPHGFTSAEFALELTRGVLEVEFHT